MMASREREVKRTKEKEIGMESKKMKTDGKERLNKRTDKRKEGRKEAEEVTEKRMAARLFLSGTHQFSLYLR